MKDVLGLQTKSGIHRLLEGLIERGYVRSIPHRARALEVLREPYDSESAIHLTPDEFKAIGYLRSHRDVMAKILERC